MGCSPGVAPATGRMESATGLDARLPMASATLGLAMVGPRTSCTYSVQRERETR